MTSTQSVPIVTGAGFDVAAAAEAVANQSGVPAHDVALVCGYGFGSLIGRFGPVTTVDLSGTGMPLPQLHGHDPTVVSVRIGGVRVLVFAGRSHLFEGVGADAVVAPVRLAAACGAEVLVQTNVAGSTGKLPVGQLVRVADHVNLTGVNPLTGPVYVPMDAAYDPELRQLAATIDPYQTEVVYGALRGPSSETPAEARMLAQMGIDVAGFSFVCETIVARQLGLRVAAFSLLTHACGAPVPHAAAVDAAEDAAETISGQLVEFLGSVPVMRSAWDLT